MTWSPFTRQPAPRPPVRTRTRDARAAASALRARAGQLGDLTLSVVVTLRLAVWLTATAAPETAADALRPCRRIAVRWAAHFAVLSLGAGRP